MTHIRMSCEVSITSFWKILLMVRKLTPNCCANHALVRAWLLSSSRMIEPMWGNCMILLFCALLPMCVSASGTNRTWTQSYPHSEALRLPTTPDKPSPRRDADI